MNFWRRDARIKKNMKQNYYIELYAVGKKKTTGYAGQDEVCAHFSTPAKVGTIAFERAKMDAVDYYWNQNQRYWLDYRVGKLFVQTGHEEVTAMCPSYFEGHRSHPVFKEIYPFR